VKLVGATRGRKSFVNEAAFACRWLVWLAANAHLGLRLHHSGVCAFCKRMRARPVRDIRIERMTKATDALARQLQELGRRTPDDLDRVGLKAVPLSGFASTVSAGPVKAPSGHGAAWKHGHESRTGWPDKFSLSASIRPSVHH
jgi:hypothetical protein